MKTEDLRQAFTSAAAEASVQLERIAAELEFAGWLAELHGDRAAGWTPLIEQAAQQVAAAAGAGAADLARAISAAEVRLAPLAATAKLYTIHCVGHAHIDMNWMWSWPETVAIVNDTFSTVLRLMDEFPEFRFSQSQASVYAIIERYHPRMLDRIRQRIAEGRWEVTASHWVECDKNLTDAESLCRHLLYTRRYMHKLFGLVAEDVPIDWSPDTFGHAATLPTYLAGGGVKYLYLHRPGTHGPARPEAFWWRGPDGSRVLVRNDQTLGYNGTITPAIAGHLVRWVRQTGIADFMFVYGVGDHGGGPTRRCVRRAIDMASWPIFPTVRFSTARAFFEKLAARADALPELDCELNSEFTGCYSSQSLIKRANRLAQNRLEDAELFAAVARAVLGADYPAADIEEGWRDTLLGQFHDILPGSGVHDTRTYAHGLFQKTAAMTGMVETLALRSLAAQVNTAPAAPAAGCCCQAQPAGTAALESRGQGAGVGFGAREGLISAAQQVCGRGDRPLVIFNPSAHDRQEVVEFTVWDNAAPGALRPLKERKFAIRQADGTLAPVQTIAGGHYWGHDFATLAFAARVKGLGYAAYTVVEDPADVPASSGATAAGGNTGAWQLGHRRLRDARHERDVWGLENDLLRVELDPVTGGIRRLLDKQRSVELITPAAACAVLEYGVERPPDMTSWTVDHFHALQPREVTGIRHTASGPCKAAIDVTLRVGQSDVMLTYELRADDPRLHLRVQATWLERGTPAIGVPTLRLSLPLALERARARYEIPFGSIERDWPAGAEAPALNWTQVTGTAGGKPAACLLLNDCKHGYSLDGNTLRLTLIRSSYDPDPLPEIRQHDMRLALLAAAPDIAVADAIAHGAAFNHPLRTVSTNLHAGPLPPQGQFVAIEPGTVVLSAVKKAEDDDALILRLLGTAATETATKIALGDALGRPTAAHVVDLLERPLAGGRAALAGQTITLAVPGRGIASVKVSLQRRS